MSNIEGEFPLHQAARVGEIDVVQDLLAKGADKDEGNNKGHTPLIEAAIKNHLDVMQYLVEQGADKEKANINGGTALMAAAAKGHIDDHQTANARYLTAAGAALLLPQPELNVENLRKAINQVMNSLNTMSQAASNSARYDATQAVVNFCVAEAAI